VQLTVGRHHIASVPTNEEVSWIGLGNQVGNYAGIRASNKQDLWLLPICKLLKQVLLVWEHFFLKLRYTFDNVFHRLLLLLAINLSSRVHKT
jgi:hypothetical protein